MTTVDDLALMTKLDSINTHIYRYAGPTICAIGTLGNILSVTVFLRRSWRKNVCVFYFLIGMLISTIYLDFTILGISLMTGFHIDLLTGNSILCKGFFYLTLVASTLAPTVLILAAIDRLLISSQNVETRLYSSRRLAYLSIGTATCFWLIFNIHVLLKVRIQQMGPSNFICYYEFTKMYQEFISYSLMIFNSLFCFIMIVLTMFAFKNVRQIRSVPRHQRSRIRSMTKKDFQLLRCLFVQMIVYTSCTVIPSAYSIYHTVTKYQIRTQLELAINDFFSNTVNILYYVYHATSFFVFITISKAFRHELQNDFHRIFGFELIPIRNEDQHVASDPVIETKPS